MRGERIKKAEGTAQQPTFFSCMKIIPDLKRALVRFTVGVPVTLPNKFFCLHLPSCLALPLSLSPAIFEELNWRENIVGWCFMEGQRAGCLVLYNLAERRLCLETEASAQERKRGEYEDEGKKEREEMAEGRREGKKEGRRERTERKKW